MTPEEFKAYFGMTPERAKQILEELRHIVNQKVHEVIAHADYYIDTVPYGYDVQTNAIMMVEGLRRALRIVEEIFLKDGDDHEG